MIERPRLKTFLTVFPITDTKWGLRGGSDELSRVELKNEHALRVFSSLLPLLTGKHRSEDILALLEKDGIDRRAASALLNRLEEFHCLEETDSAGLEPEELERYRPQITFFSHFTSEGGAKLQAKLGQSRVAVVADGLLGQAVCRQLEAAGVGEILLLGGDAERQGEQPFADGSGNGSSIQSLPLDRVSIWPEETTAAFPDLILVLQEAYDLNFLEAMDSFSKKHGVAWMLARLLSVKEGWVGPLFVPGETASYLSFEARLRGNLPFFEEYEAFQQYLQEAGEAGPPCGGTLASFEILGGVAVAEAIKFLTEYDVPHLAGRLLTLNLMTWETELHDVLRVPRLDRVTPSPPTPFPWKEALYGDSDTHKRRA